MDQENGPALVQLPEDIDKTPMVSSKGRDVARRAMEADARAAPLLKTLLNDGLASDALRIAPFVLPIRQAVWWGCVWLWHVTGDSPHGTKIPALAAAVHWVQEPTPRRVGEANEAWRAAGIKSAAGCCARAAAFAGRLAADGKSFESDKPRGAAKTLAGGATIALLVAARDRVAASPAQFVGFAIDIAEGKVPWEIERDEQEH